MNQRENLLSLYRRKGFEQAPVCFNLCTSLENECKKKHLSQKS